MNSQSVVGDVKCRVVVRYFSSPVHAPVRPLSASSQLCRQLVVDTSVSAADGLQHPSSLLRSLSQRQPADVSPPPPATVRQTSCPEPTASCPPTSQRVDFVTDEPVCNEWLSCVVSHVDDPENFYCQLTGTDNAERLETLMSQIDKYVGCLPPGIGKLRTATLGQPVIATYAQDGAWYRARVTGTLHCGCRRLLSS